MQDHRDRNKQRNHHGQLERGEERRSHVSGDHRGTHGQIFTQWCGNQGVDLLREGEQPGEDQENCRDAAQQTGTQFSQVRNQRHWLVVFGLLVSGDVAHALKGLAVAGLSRVALPVEAQGRMGAWSGSRAQGWPARPQLQGQLAA